MQWATQDGGAEWGRLCDRIKMNELLVLRAVRFDIVAGDSECATGLFAAAATDLVPSSLYALNNFEGIQAVALGISMDFLMWPESRLYSLRDIAYAAVFKAAIALKLPILSGSTLTSKQKNFFSDNENWRSLLQDFRQTYDWLAELHEC